MSESKKTTVTSFVPNYKRKCENCDMSPTVKGVNESGATVYNSDMCGPCTWGESAMLDPDKWND